MNTLNQPMKITIDELARMINKGFKESNENLKTEVNRLEGKIDEGFKKVKNQINEIKIDYVRSNEHSLLKNRVKRIERKIGIPAIA